MFADGVIEASSTVGTGTYVLTGAVFSGQTFAQGIPAGGAAAFFAQTADKSKWEFGYGVLTIGPPRTLTRATILKSSNAGSAIDWQSTDTYYVFSIASADVLAGLMAGNLADGTRPWWVRAGGRWWNYAAGLAVSWIDNLFNGTDDIRIGLYDAVKALYFPDGRRASTAVGAANKAFDATHIGGSFTFSTSAAARTATLPAGPAVGKDGYHLEIKGLSPVNGIVLTPDAGDGIDGGADGVTKTIPGGVLFTIRWDSAADQWVTNYPGAAPAFAGVRQTVAAGPVDTAGLPTFLPSTNAALSINSQNVSVSVPLVAAAANGWSAATGQPVDRVGFSTANLSWTGLTLNRAAATPNFLYATVNADGSLTPASTILPPVYQWGGTPATTSGQITFNIAEMKGYLGNGATAPQAYVVVFGEAATDATTVISTVAYAYNGRYESAFTATLPAQQVATPASHNIGVKPRLFDFVIENTTTDNGFAVGDQLNLVSLATDNGSASLFMKPALTVSTKAITMTSGHNNSTSPWVTVGKASGIDVDLTVGSWKYGFRAARGW